MSKKHGEITAALGAALSSSPELLTRGYSVLYDHGKGVSDDAGVTSAWIGDRKRQDNRLAEIDIVIFEEVGKKAVLLIEIEESGDNPKKIIGAAMAILFGEKISSSGWEDLQIGGWTTLLVLAKGEGDAHINRAQLIEEKINQIIGVEAINSMKVGSAKMALFQTEDELRGSILDALKSRSPME